MLYPETQLWLEWVLWCFLVGLPSLMVMGCFFNRTFRECMIRCGKRYCGVVHFTLLAPIDPRSRLQVIKTTIDMAAEATRGSDKGALLCVCVCRVAAATACGAGGRHSGRCANDCLSPSCGVTCCASAVEWKREKSFRAVEERIKRAYWAGNDLMVRSLRGIKEAAKAFRAKEALTMGARCVHAH